MEVPGSRPVRIPPGRGHIGQLTSRVVQVGWVGVRPRDPAPLEIWGSSEERSVCRHVRSEEGTDGGDDCLCADLGAPTREGQWS